MIPVCPSEIPVSPENKCIFLILNIQIMINPCLGCFMVPCRTSKQKKVVILTFDTNFRTHRNLILLACPVLWNWSLSKSITGIKRKKVEHWALFCLLPPAAILDEMKGPKSVQFPSFRPRWPTNKLAGGNKRKSAEHCPLPLDLILRGSVVHSTHCLAFSRLKTRTRRFCANILILALAKIV